MEEGKAYRLEVLEEWTGDKYYTELGELERKIDGLTTAEKDSRQRAVLAARDLRTTITDIKNASVDEAVAIHQKKTAERDASVAEREKLGLENQKAKEELRSAEEEFKARANQQHNTKGPLNKLNEERKGKVKEAEGIMNLANKDPDSTPADFAFAKDNLIEADNELFNAPKDALDKMILDAAGKPISTPRLTMYRDRVRKLDARINRIFEGTNEINRLLIPGMLLRRALKGQLPLMQAAQRLQKELLEPSFEEPEDLELHQVQNLKKLALMVAGLAVQKYGQGVEEEQEVLGAVADILIDAYAAESALLRARRLGGLAPVLARIYLAQALDRAQAGALSVLPRLVEGDEARVVYSAARRLTKREPVDLVALRRQAAEAVLEAGGYPIPR